eukprot:Em0004g1215a
MVSDGDTDEYSYLRAVKELNHPQGDPVTGSGRYRHSSLSLRQSTLEGAEVEPPPRRPCDRKAACHYDSPPWRVKRLNHPQGDPVTGSGRYRHSSMSLQQSTLEGEEVEPPPRAACHYDSPPWRVKRLNHPQGDPVAGSGRYRHSSMSLQQSTLEGEEVEPPPRAACHYNSPPWRVKRLNHPQGDPVTGSGRYRHSSMSLQQSTLEGEEVEPPQGDPVTGSGRYRHSSMSLQQSTLEGEEVEPPPRAACHYNSPPWRVKRLNHPQGDPVTGSGCYRHSSMSLRQSTMEGEEVEPPPRAACHYDSPPWRVKRLNHPQGDPVAGSGRYRHSSMSLQQSTLEGEEVEPPPRAACHYDSPPWRVKRLNHPQGDPVAGSGRYRHSSMSLQQSTLEGEEVEPPQGDPVTGSGRYRHSSMSLRQSTLEGEEVEPPPRAACHYNSPPWRVKRLNHPQGDPVTGSGRYRHSSMSLQQSTLEGEEVEPPQGDPVTGSGRYRHSSMSLQQSTLEGEEVEPPPRAACHYNSPPWRVKRLNHPQGDPVTGSGRYRHSSMSLQQSTLEGEEVEPPQGDPVTGSGRYRHSSMSLQQSTLEGEEVEPPPRAACHCNSPPWRVKRLNHPQGDPVTGSGRYRHSSMSLQQSTLEGEEVEPPPRAARHYDSPPWRVKRLNHPQGDPVTGSGRYRHSSMSLQQSTLEGEEVAPPPRAACHYDSPPWRVKRLNHPQGDPVTGSGRYRHDIMAGYFGKEAFDITTTIDTRPSSFYIST